MLKIISLFFLIMIQLFLSVAHSGPKEDADTAQRHKLVMQRVMVFVENPGEYNMDIIVKRKNSYGQESYGQKLSAEEEFLRRREESENIRSFIKNLSGVIVIYDLSAKEKALEYNLPFSDDNPNGFCCNQFYSGINGDVWQGLTLSGGKMKSIGNYMIYADLYTENHAYDEYVLTFTPERGFK